MNPKKIALMLCLAACASGPMMAQEHERSVPHLDHVFVILMENHYYGQIIGNANAPFINSYAATANLAKNYYAVGHPSLTNYLEIVGGSNFGILNDDSPDWHDTGCVSNLEIGPDCARVRDYEHLPHRRARHGRGHTRRGYIQRGHA